MVKLDPTRSKLDPKRVERIEAGFGTDGQSRTQPPTGRITLHDLKFRTARGIPMVVSNSSPMIRTVLLHDPGAVWIWGVKPGRCDQARLFSTSSAVAGAFMASGRPPAWATASRSASNTLIASMNGGSPTALLP